MSTLNKLRGQYITEKNPKEATEILVKWIRELNIELDSQPTFKNINK